MFGNRKGNLVMKITKIDLLHAYPVEDGWRPLFVRVYTDEGIYGDGEAALSYGDVDEAAFGMLKNMAPMLIGMDPLDHEVIWDKLYHSCFWGLNGGPVLSTSLYGTSKARNSTFPCISCWAASCVQNSVPMPASCRTAGKGTGIRADRWKIIGRRPEKLCAEALMLSNSISLPSGKTAPGMSIMNRHLIWTMPI